MKARACIRVDSGRSVLNAEPPLALRLSYDGIYMVSAAAYPIGGDDVSLDVDVAPGSTSTIRAAAATVALPGHDGGESIFTVRARVGAHGCIHWRPEPLVVAANCRHRVVANVEVAAGATLQWRDEMVLGRSGEEPGACASRLHVERAGAPLLRHDIVIDEYAQSLGVLGTARAVGTLLLVGTTAPTMSPMADIEAEVFPLADDAALVVVLGDRVDAVRGSLLDAEECAARAGR